MGGVPARWGDPACGMPTLLGPVQAEEQNEPGPLPHFEPGSPFWPGSPVLHLFGNEPGPPNEPGPLASPEKINPEEGEYLE